MNRRDFIAGAVGGFIVGAGVGYAIGRRKPDTPASTETQSGSNAPDLPGAPATSSEVSKSSS